MSLTKNTLANYFGRGWEALMGLAFVPLYIRYLGMEAWGLVGFMIMLQAWFTLLDMGITPALNREMARFTAGAHTPQTIRDLLRSLEWMYGGIATVVMLAVGLAAPWIAGHWLSASALPQETVAQAIVIMGGVLAARMAEQVYCGAIQGLQRMVWLGGAQAVLATLRWGGAAVIVVWITPSIQAFFLWHGLMSLVTVLVFAQRANHYLPQASRPARFDWAAIRAIRRFAGGMMTITLLALLLTQIDKLLLSKLASLSEFGVYTLATTVAGALSFLAMPLNTAVLPKLTELVTRNDQAGLIATYHRASQWMAVILIPPALVMAAFAEPLLWAWTGDVHLARKAAPLLSLLALGTMMNGFMRIPYMAQLAHQWVRLTVCVNAVALTIIIPALLWAVPRYGAIGAAWVWCALNTGYVLIGIHFMYRKILQGEQWQWYGRAVGLPLAVASGIVFAMKFAAPAFSGRVESVLFICMAGGLAFCATLLTTPAPAAFVRSQFFRVKGTLGHD